MARYPTFKRSCIAAAAWLAATSAWAQTAPAPSSPASAASAAPTTQLDAVTVTGRAALPVSVGGWGDIPLAKTPLQASVFSAVQLRDAGAQRLDRKSVV